jgi:prepilin peptidase CpaA
VLTVALGMWHVTRRSKERLKIPYGVAIALAGLLTIGRTDAAHWHDASALAGPGNGAVHVTAAVHGPVRVPGK